jgi:hypothetical protein
MAFRLRLKLTPPRPKIHFNARELTRFNGPASGEHDDKQFLVKRQVSRLIRLTETSTRSAHQRLNRYP